MALEWLKTILGDKYTPEIDTAVSQEIGKGFVSRTDFNTTSGKLKEAEAQVTQLTESVKTRDSQLEELKKSAGAGEELQKQIETLTQQNKDQKAAYDKELATVKLMAAVDAELRRGQERHRRPGRAGGLPQGRQNCGRQGHLQGQHWHRDPGGQGGGAEKGRLHGLPLWGGPQVQRLETRRGRGRRWKARRGQKAL